MEEGWILDAYPGLPGEMVVWIKKEDGRAVRCTDAWKNAIYVAADDRRDLDWLATRKEMKEHVASSGFVTKLERVFDTEEREVLMLTLKRAGDAELLAKVVERSAELGTYRIYNADLLPAQSYLIEKGLFPLAKVRAEKVGESVHWTTLDKVDDIDYAVPPLKSVVLTVEADSRTIPKLTDPIRRIKLDSREDGTLTIDSGSESAKLLALVSAIRSLDPDLVFTRDGDEFVVNYLAERAWANGIADKLILGRDEVPLRRLKNRGTSYFAYGKILFTPTSQMFYGRLNLDAGNHFVVGESGLDGLIEVARICRMPLHKGSRASIGKCLSGIQFCIAYKRNLLIPWKPTRAEVPKTGRTLLTGDRGGFIYEPRPGVHENVGEIDFASLYPYIISKNKISAETVLCRCCPGSKLRVPDVGYHICEKRKDGLVAESLKLILEKRAEYKAMAKNEAADPALRARAAARADALKGILVCSFGYLSYRNAKFGLIDCHIAVCAFARQILLDTARIAERHGFEVVHGIVDSLWLKKQGAAKEDYLSLCREIKSTCGISISFEGVYRWVAFLPSRTHQNVPVLNRYFGVFEDGRMKFRGIELRRSDTVKLVADCQKEILDLFSSAANVREAKELIPDAVAIFRAYLASLRSNRVPLEDLIIVNRLSRNFNEYTGNTVQASAARQLADEGLELMAGQSVSYVVTRASSKMPLEKAKPYQLVDQTTSYDKAKYAELLLRGVLAVLEPFGVDEKQLNGYMNGFQEANETKAAVDVYGNTTLEQTIGGTS